MTEQLSLDQLLRMADGASMPPPPEGEEDNAALLTMDDLSRLGAQPDLGAYTGGEEEGFGLEVAKAVPRGIGAAYEGMLDIAEAAPVIGALPRTMTSFYGGIAEDWDKDLGLKARLERGLSGAKEELVESAKDPLTRGFSETASDRLRQRAIEATFDTKALARRDRKSPFENAVVSGVEIGAGAATMPAGATVKAAIPVVGSMLGGGTGRYIAESLGADDDVISLAEGGGSLVGALAPLAKQLPGLYRRGVNVVESLIKRLSGNTEAPPETIKQAVAAFIQREVMQGDPSTNLKNLEAALKRGDRGMMSTLMDDLDNPEARALAARIRGVEQQLPRGMSTNAQERDVGTRAIKQANRDTTLRAREMVEDVAEGGDTAAAAAPMVARQKQRISTLRLAQKTRAERAERAGKLAADAEARAAARVAGPEATEASRSLDVGMTKARNALKAKELAAWNKVPGDKTMQTGVLKNDVKAVLDSLGEEKLARYDTGEIGKVLERVMNMPGRYPYDEVLELQRSLKQAIPRAVAKGEVAPGDADRITTMIIKAMDKRINTTRMSPPLKRAIAASRERAQLVDSGLVGEARRTVAKTGAPEAAADVVGKAGGKGARLKDVYTAERAAVKAGATPGEMTKPTEDILRAEFRNAATPDGGTPSVTRAQGWLNRRKAALEDLPELREEFTKAIDDLRQSGPLRASQKASAAASKAVKAATDKQVNNPTNITGKFAKTEDPVAAALDVLNSKTPRSSTKRLLATVKNSGDPQKLKNFQSAYRDAFLEKVANSGNSLDASATEKLKKMEAVLSDVLDPEDMKQVKGAVDLVRRMSGGETVPAQDLANILNSGGPMGVTFARILGANLGSMTTNPLIAASLASTAAQKLLRNIPRQQARTALLRYLTNPQAYVDDIKVLGSKQATQKAVTAALDNITRPITATATTAVGRYED